MRRCFFRLRAAADLIADRSLLPYRVGPVEAAGTDEVLMGLQFTHL